MVQDFVHPQYFGDVGVWWQVFPPKRGREQTGLVFDWSPAFSAAPFSPSPNCQEASPSMTPVYKATCFQLKGDVHGQPNRDLWALWAWLLKHVNTFLVASAASFQPACETGVSFLKGPPKERLVSCWRTLHPLQQNKEVPQRNDSRLVLGRIRRQSLPIDRNLLRPG